MKLYFGNGVTTATTIMLFVLLGFLGDSIWHRENIVYWGRRTLFVLLFGLAHLLLRRSAGRTGQNHPARHRRQLRPWPVSTGQRAHADRLCGGGADPDRRHRHTHRQIPGAAGGLVLPRLCGRHAENPDRRNLPAPHPLTLTLYCETMTKTRVPTIGWVPVSVFYSVSVMANWAPTSFPGYFSSGCLTT